MEEVRRTRRPVLITKRGRIVAQLAPPPLLDTRAWFWWLDGSGSPTRRTRARLDAYPDADRPALCAISLWEMALLVELRRVQLRQGFDAWIDVAAGPGTVRLLDTTPAIAKELLHLPRTFHRIVACAPAATARSNTASTFGT